MYHVEAEHREPEDADSHEESDVLIDFVPDAAHLARPARPSPNPLLTRRVLIATGVVAATVVVFIALAMKPGPQSVRAATPQVSPASRQADRVISSDPTSDNFQLFVLPDWVEEDATNRTK